MKSLRQVLFGIALSCLIGGCASRATLCEPVDLQAIVAEGEEPRERAELLALLAAFLDAECSCNFDDELLDHMTFGGDHSRRPTTEEELGPCLGPLDVLSMTFASANYGDVHINRPSGRRVDDGWSIIAAHSPDGWLLYPPQPARGTIN